MSALVGLAGLGKARDAAQAVPAEVATLLGKWSLLRWDDAEPRCTLVLCGTAVPQGRALQIPATRRLARSLARVVAWDFRDDAESILLKDSAGCAVHRFVEGDAGCWTTPADAGPRYIFAQDW